MITRAAIAALLLVASAGAAARADERVTLVHPSGTFPVDLERVQAAVDGGGTVALAATNAEGTPTAFDFGPAVEGAAGQVDLNADVQIIGEPGATIRGGTVPFFGPAAVDIRIAGITFDAPLLSAVIVTHATSVEIVDNHITGVVGSRLPGVTGATDPSEGRGIKLLGNTDPDGAITGTVLIEGNVIDDLHADLSDAIVFDAVAADVTVRGNRIGTTQSSGVLVISGGGAVDIVDNVIVPGPGDEEGLSHGNGVTIVGDRGGEVRIAGNEITCANPVADGVHLVGGGRFDAIVGAEVVDNVITMVDSAHAAVAIEDVVSDSTVRGNDFVGAANHAVEVRSGTDGTVADANTIVANDSRALVARAGMLYLDRNAQATRATGSGMVTDMGEANVVGALTRFPVGLPQPAVSATVVVPLPGPGAPFEPLTASPAPFEIQGETVDDARLRVVARPVVPGDVDLLVQRLRTDGSWMTVGSAATFDVEQEQLVLRRQPPGSYRVLVHSFVGGPQVVDVVVTFEAQPHR